MFGAFKPSAPLSGGLLWKIPWRISAPRKLRQRRRLRRVDNVVSVLDTALKRQNAPASSAPTPTHGPKQLPNEHQHQRHARGKATPEELSTTAEGQRLLSEETTPAHLRERRHGRGPHQGEYVPAFTSDSATTSTLAPTSTLLSTEAGAKGTTAALERWKASMPTEGEMLPRDKYTMFDKKAEKYRKGVHKLPKWTRVSQRVNPPGF